jgi:hypothetical protein
MPPLRGETDYFSELEKRDIRVHETAGLKPVVRTSSEG